MSKRIVVLAVVAGLAFGAAWARAQQEHPTKQAQPAKAEHPAAAPEKGGKQMSPAARRAAHMKENLGLTDEQTAKVQAAFEDFQKKNAELRTQAAEMTPEERATRMQTRKKNQEELQTQLKGILTPEQWEKHQSQGRPAAREKKQEHPEGQKPPQP